MSIAATVALLEDKGVFASLKRSCDLTDGQTLKMMFISIIVMFIVMIGALMPFFSFYTYPYLIIGYYVVYIRLVKIQKNKFFEKDENIDLLVTD